MKKNPEPNSSRERNNQIILSVESCHSSINGRGWRI